MYPHDFMTLHAAKTVEYLIALAYLLLFIPFWRYVNARPAPAPAHEHAALTARSLEDLFAVPAHLFYHFGHAWVRVEDHETATVGFNDFAAKLVGEPSDIALPKVGALLTQGEPAWTFLVDGKTIDMLSPIDGTVVGVNERVRRAPQEAHARPYDGGWLLKVRAPRLAANAKQLMPGAFAKRWIATLAEGLRGPLSPALGAVYEDGGVVVDGLARVLDPDGWETVARRYLLTEPNGFDAAPDGNHRGESTRAADMQAGDGKATRGGDHA